MIDLIAVGAVFALIALIMWGSQKNTDRFLERIECDANECEHNRRGYCSADKLRFEVEQEFDIEDNIKTEKVVCQTYEPQL